MGKSGCYPKPIDNVMGIFRIDSSHLNPFFFLYSMKEKTTSQKSADQNWGKQREARVLCSFQEKQLLYPAA
jgi:hypothetical protein